jgi:hypothetical protein
MIISNIIALSVYLFLSLVAWFDGRFFVSFTCFIFAYSRFEIIILRAQLNKKEKKPKH